MSGIMLKNRVIFLLLVGLIYLCLSSACRTKASTCHTTPDGRKLHVALYYESLCPDCQFFVTQQLKPIYEDIKNHVELLLVPFGKSESENNGENFYCQHGPAECTGNRIQSCVLDAINYDQDTSVRYIDCQMQRNADFSGKECARLVNVTYETLLSCQTGLKGVELQLKAENETHIVARPYPPFVPFVVYNRTLKRDQQKRSEREFGKVVCEQLATIYCENAMPSICINAPTSSSLE